METKNRAFIATSIDGYIADKNGGIEWLHAIPNPEGIDMGYNKFFSETDAVVIGRKTFETVCGLDMEWPYKKPVFVLSNSLANIPEEYQKHAELVQGALKEILEKIHTSGYFRLYIDGGRTIQSFLKEDLIDEMMITIIPFVLGGGIPLFGKLPEKLAFECVDSEIYLDKIVQNRFVRKRQIENSSF